MRASVHSAPNVEFGHVCSTGWYVNSIRDQFSTLRILERCKAHKTGRSDTVLMCSDGRAIWSPNDAKVGNLICLKVSSLTARLGFLGSEALSHCRWWFMVVSDCWKRIMSEGPRYRVCILSWGCRDSLRQDLSFIFFTEGIWLVTRPMWRCVKLYCPDVFIHTATIEKEKEKSHYTCQEARFDVWGHLCDVYAPPRRTYMCLYTCASFSAPLCIFLCVFCSPFTGAWLWTQTVSRYVLVGLWHMGTAE